MPRLRSSLLAGLARFGPAVIALGSAACGRGLPENVPPSTNVAALGRQVGLPVAPSRVWWHVARGASSGRTGVVWSALEAMLEFPPERTAAMRAAVQASPRQTDGYAYLPSFDWMPPDAQAIVNATAGYVAPSVHANAFGRGSFPRPQDQLDWVTPMDASGRYYLLRISVSRPF